MKNLININICDIIMLFPSYYYNILKGRKHKCILLFITLQFTF